MDWLRVENGVVTNIEVHDGTPDPVPGVTWAQHDGAGIGWTFDGTTWAAPAPVTVVPASITSLQAALVLNAHGLYPQVQQAVLAAPLEVQLFFNRAPNWLRTDPNIAALGTSLGLTSAQIDALFVEGATL